MVKQFLFRFERLILDRQRIKKMLPNHSASDGGASASGHGHDASEQEGPSRGTVVWGHCGICLELLSEGASFLLCGHGFHDDCLSKMSDGGAAMYNIRCPLCQMDRRSLTELADSVVERGQEANVIRARVVVWDRGFVLLVQERNGLWNLPGGKLEQVDGREARMRLGVVDAVSPLQVCARRELSEETGLTPNRLEFLDIVEGQAVFTARYPDLSWRTIRTAYWYTGGRTGEIRGVWWGAVDDALAEAQVTDRTKLVLVLLRTRTDFDAAACWQ